MLAMKIQIFSHSTNHSIETRNRNCAIRLGDGIHDPNQWSFSNVNQKCYRIKNKLT